MGIALKKFEWITVPDITGDLHPVLFADKFAMADLLRYGGSDIWNIRILGSLSRTPEIYAGLEFAKSVAEEKLSEVLNDILHPHTFTGEIHQ